jgi:hypothetical protein
LRNGNGSADAGALPDLVRGANRPCVFEILLLDAKEMFAAGDPGRVSVEEMGFSSVSFSTSTSESSSSGSSKNADGDSPSLEVFRRRDLLLLTPELSNPTLFSKPPVGGGVSRCDDGGGVVGRPLAVFLAAI